MDLPHLLLLCLLGAGWSSAARVLLLPTDHKGHINTFSVAGKELQAKGHHVVILATEKNRHVVEKHGITGVFPKSQNPEEDYKNIEESLLMTGFLKMWNVAKLYSAKKENFNAFCRHVAADETIMERFRQEKFDIALVDGGVTARCAYVIAYKLNIPYITLSPLHEPWRVGIPAMPSSEGFMGFVLLPPEYSYLTALQNLMIYTVLYTMNSNHNDALIREMAPEMPETTYHELFKASGVHMVNTDNTCVDYPRLEAPHYHFIGGLGASPAKPLEPSFAEFVDSAKHGVVVVSFGSFIKRVPGTMMAKMMPVFRRLQQKVVMRYDGDFADVPPNVMLTKWLPQNDLLGHPNTRLFIAHGGLNGQMEGLYHGVPMIVMPLAVDQNYNAQRVVRKKFGVMLEPFSFTSDELFNAISEILNNPVYSDSMKKCSRISKSFPNAHDTIDFWIRHVLEFGSDHLKPLSVDLPLWRLFMLDVLLGLLLLDLVICYGTYRCCKCCYRRCCKRNAGKVKGE